MVLTLSCVETLSGRMPAAGVAFDSGSAGIGARNDGAPPGAPVS